MSKEKIGKVLNIILKIFTWLVVAVTVFMMVFTIISVNTFDKNDRSIFGIRFYIVKTDSMSPSENNKDMDVHFSAGDIVLIKEVENKRALKADDIIAFISTNTDTYGETITHMIRDVNTNADGQIIGYTTFGTNTGTNDAAMVEPDYVIGQYTGKIPKVGWFFQFLQTTQGYIVCILIPFLLLIGYNGLNCILLFRRYKKEQTEEMNAERAKIEAERDQALAMMKELQELKAQMESGNATSTKENEPADQEKTDAVAETAEVAEKAETAEVAENTAESVETVAVEANSDEATDIATVEDTTAKESQEVNNELEAERQKNLEMAKELEALKAQAALEEEKRKTQEMMKELEALKAQLAQKQNEDNNEQN